jgi:RNA polymerase sigma-70 factor (ECF subfamily)
LSYWRKWKAQRNSGQPDLIGRMAGERHRREVAALYTAAREGVVRYLMAIGFDMEAAEEATQDAFLRLYTALRDGEEIQQPSSWVYRVAHNLAITTAKRGARYSALSDVLEGTVLSGESSVEEQLIEKEQMKGFREAVQRLSERQRACLELRVQGLRFSEIAAILEIQKSTAAEFVRRGIEELKKWNKCRS